MTMTRRTTFQLLEASSALTPSQIVFPLFCFALHTWGISRCDIITMIMMILIFIKMIRNGGYWVSEEGFSLDLIVILYNVDNNDSHNNNKNNLIVILCNVDNLQIFLLISRNHQRSTQATAVLVSIPVFKLLYTCVHKDQTFRSGLVRFSIIGGLHKIWF